MDHLLPICDACGQPYEHHRPIGMSADGRKKKITCIFDKEGKILPEQRMYAQLLFQEAFQRQLGGNERTFVDKLEYEAVKKALADEQQNVMDLAEEHRVELERLREERQLLEEDLRKAEARAREAEKKAVTMKTDLIDTGRKLIVARDRLMPVEDENALLRKRNIELERLNATLDERIRHATTNGTGKRPFSTLEDSAPATTNPQQKE